MSLLLLFQHIQWEFPRHLMKQLLILLISWININHQSWNVINNTWLSHKNTFSQQYCKVIRTSRTMSLVNYFHIKFHLDFCHNRQQWRGLTWMLYVWLRETRRQKEIRKRNRGQCENYEIFTFLRKFNSLPLQTLLNHKPHL